MDLSFFEKKIFSQNGEDGITMKLVELIYNGDNENKYYVEFGVDNGMECNTRILREYYDWKGLQMDGCNENDSINLRKEFIMRENIVELFKKYNVPQNINVLSVDIDFNDFYCLKEILTNYQCDIIICEYNATHLANEDKIVIYDKNGRWDGSNYFGASLLSLEKLGKKYNYSLVYCDKKGVNCFLIHNDVIKDKNLQIKNIGDVSQIFQPAGYGNGPNGGHKQDSYNRQFITFDEAMKEMNNLELLQVYSFDKKIRYGSNNDGGYIIAELDDKYDCYISAGISDEESFSRDFINRYTMNEFNSFGFDGTINSYPYYYTKNISFIKKNINSFNDDDNSNLSFLINNFNNIFLKMDIEGGEYPWLLQIDESQLNKFKQIVIEFHGITNDGWNCNYKDKIKCLEKLSKTHYIVHAHGNNYGPIVNNIPDVIELTYVNKNYFTSVPKFNTQILPVANLDFPNNGYYNDINLNFYPFVSTNKTI